MKEVQMHQFSSYPLKESWDRTPFLKAVRDRSRDLLTLLGVLLIGTVLAGCGGSGNSTGSGGTGAVTSSGPGISTMMVTGVAATGAPLAGLVTLRDASARPLD